MLVDPAVTPRAVFQATTDGGAHWSAHPSPCDAAASERLLVAAATPTSAALLCSTVTQPGFTTKRVFSSTDTARASTEQGGAPTVDLPQGLAITGRVVVIADAGGSSTLQRSADQGASWTTPYASDPAGLSDLALRGTTGAVVRGSARNSGGAGQLLLSHDTGQQWAVGTVRVRTG